MGGKKKKASTEALLARAAKAKADEGDGDWENDSEKLEAEREQAAAASNTVAPEVAKLQSPSQCPLGADKAAQAAIARRERELAKARVVANAAVKAKKSGSKSKVATNAKANQAAANTAAVEAERQRRAAVEAQVARSVLERADSLLREVRPQALNVQSLAETIEEWKALGCGGFERVLVGIHPGVSCDRSGQCPIIGLRYKMRKEFCVGLPMGYDVCQEEFRRMGAEEAARYDEIAPSATQPLVYAAAAEHDDVVIHTLASCGGGLQETT